MLPQVLPHFRANPLNLSLSTDSQRRTPPPSAKPQVLFVAFESHLPRNMLYVPMRRRTRSYRRLHTATRRRIPQNEPTHTPTGRHLPTQAPTHTLTRRHTPTNAYTFADKHHDIRRHTADTQPVADTYANKCTDMFIAKLISAAPMPPHSPGLVTALGGWRKGGRKGAQLAGYLRK